MQKKRIGLLALLVMTLLFIVINILLDIGYKLIDPRVELN